MNTPSSSEELRSLMLRQLEGHATPDEARTLSAALRESPEERRELFNVFRRHEPSMAAALVRLPLVMVGRHTGLKDVRAKVLRPVVGKGEEQTWLNDNPSLVLRFLKFVVKVKVNRIF